MNSSPEEEALASTADHTLRFLEDGLSYAAKSVDIRFDYIFKFSNSTSVEEFSDLINEAFKECILPIGDTLRGGSLPPPGFILKPQESYLCEFTNRRFSVMTVLLQMAVSAFADMTGQGLQCVDSRKPTSSTWVDGSFGPSTSRAALEFAICVGMAEGFGRDLLSDSVPKGQEMNLLTFLAFYKVGEAGGHR